MECGAANRKTGEDKWAPQLTKNEKKKKKKKHEKTDKKKTRISSQERM